MFQTNDFAQCISSLSYNFSTSLQEIDVMKGSVVKVGSLEKSLGHFPSLHTLTLSGLGIETMRASVLDHLGNVYTLSLAENNLQTLTNDTFVSKALIDLDSLDLAKNQITDIAPGTFSPLTNLFKLNLSGNAIANIHPGTFARLTILDSLDLSGNKLKNLDNAMIDGLVSLKSLLLSKNQISIMDLNKTRKFPLTNLITLDLSSNGILNLNYIQAVHVLSALEMLRLDNNTIANITFTPFSTLCQLETLNLSNSKIERLVNERENKEVSCKHRSLAIDLRGNKLQYIGRNAFQ